MLNLLVSGELFYKTSTAVSSSDFPLGPGLQDFLASEPPQGTCSGTERDAPLELLRLSRDLSSQLRSAKITSLLSCRKLAQQLTSSTLSGLRQQSLKRTAAEVSLIDSLQKRLALLCILFSKVVEEESKVCSGRIAWEDKISCRLEEAMKLEQRLALFSLHIQHETRGSIILRPLGSNHPQHLRCLRAATENVKKDFFKRKGCRFKGVKVKNVYKIENRLLLDDFQSSAKNGSAGGEGGGGGGGGGAEAGKVKGLFCGVPIDCLENVVVYGVRGKGGGHGRIGSGEKGDEGKEGDGFDGIDAFQETWYDSMKDKGGGSGGGGGGGGGAGEQSMGFAKRAVMRGSSIPFPRAFSRHSTLEEDRDFVQGEGRRGGEGGGLGGETNIRFLALCRVMIGKILVAKQPAESTKQEEGEAVMPAPFPSGPGTDGYDSLYSPAREEYKLLNERYVLPEFLVQYEFEERSDEEEEWGVGDGEAGREAKERGSLFNINLNSTEINLPSGALSEIGSKENVSAFPVGSDFGVDMQAQPAASGEGGEEQSRPTTKDELWLQKRKNAQRQKVIVTRGVENAFKEYYSEVRNGGRERLFEAGIMNTNNSLIE